MWSRGFLKKLLSKAKKRFEISSHGGGVEEDKTTDGQYCTAGMIVHAENMASLSTDYSIWRGRERSKLAVVTT